MAGIGWRLERLLDEGITGATAAYAMGAAVMALPWALTTVVLASLPVVLGARADLAAASAVVNTAYAVAMLASGPIQIVASRYAADRVYERRPRAIAEPFCRALGTTFPACALPAAVALLALGQPVRSALWGAALSAVVGAQWTALSVGNGLCSPALVPVAVVSGAALSFLLAAALVVAGLGVPGYLFGMVSGQTLSLVILLVGILRALPDETEAGVSLLAAFRDYATLAAAGLAFNASLWIDKLVVQCLAGGPAAALHSGASTLAWFSAIPCLAWIFVEVETRFHRRFRSFYLALESGASLAELRGGVRTLLTEARRLLGGAVSVQAGTIAFLEAAAGPVAHWLGLPPAEVLAYRLLLVATGAQSVGLLGLILLYYFDARRDACLAAAALLAAVTAFTAAAIASGLPPGAGTALGCVAGALLVWRLVFRGVSAVLQHALVDQPLDAG